MNAVSTRPISRSQHLYREAADKAFTAYVNDVAFLRGEGADQDVIDTRKLAYQEQIRDLREDYGVESY